jgi:hypothetical protein
VRYVAVIFAVMCAIAIANIDIKPTRTVFKDRVVTKTVTKVKTKVVRSPAGPIPDGYLSAAECRSLGRRKGMTLRQVLLQYSWPVGENGANSEDDYVDYTIREDQAKECYLRIYDHVLEYTEIRDR